MTDAAFVVKGTGTSGSGNWVSSSKYATCSPIPAVDPEIQLNTDKTASTPFARGDGHLLITLPPWGVNGMKKATNVYSWNDSMTWIFCADISYDTSKVAWTSTYTGRSAWASSAIRGEVAFCFWAIDQLLY